MSAFLRYGLVIAILVALVMGTWLVPVGAEEDEDGGLSMDGLATHLAKARITLAAACETAAKAANGQAFAAEFEVEGDVVLYDVLVLVPGTPPKLFEVEVDAVTGKVIEIEEEGDDDEDDDDDEEDEGEEDDD